MKTFRKNETNKQNQKIIGKWQKKLENAGKVGKSRDNLKMKIS